MPDDRMIHRRCCRSQKVSGLSDFEFRVWMQYQLSADDFGVMLRSASKVQGDNAYFDKLKARGARLIEKALDTLVNVGLVHTFEHQGELYVFQTDWQDYQKLKHARHTIQPFPPADALAKCTPKTQALFLEQHNGKISEEVRRDSSNPSETFTPLAGAGARETAHGKRQEANGSRQTAIARRGVQGGALVGGGYATHAKHGACNDRGLCVPRFLHDEFVAKVSGDAATVQRFYDETLQALPVDAVPGEDAIEFWRAAWKRAFGTTTRTGAVSRMRTATEDFVRAGGQS